jgi:hypothetical protein
MIGVGKAEELQAMIRSCISLSGARQSVQFYS